MLFNRYEHKFFINEVEMMRLISSLSQIMQLDKHCTDEKAYRVRSLYFDSFDDECLFEKQSGQLKRSKVRLRVYGTSDHQISKLELKSKKGQFISKRSFLLDRGCAEEVNMGHYRSILELDDPISTLIYAKFIEKNYKPKVIVEYDRLAFLFPISNVRVTFDMNLSSNINHVDLYSRVRSAIPVIQEKKQIMEVKYDQFLPSHIQKVLSSVNSERSAISKYTLSRRFHKIQKWEDN